MTGDVDGDIGLSVLSSLHTILELEDMSVNEVYQTLKDGNLSDMVFIRPEFGLNPSSVLDEAILEDKQNRHSIRVVGRKGS